MNRRMKAALADAWPGGLLRVRDGWMARDRRGEIVAHATRHAPQSVTALIDRGLLVVFGRAATGDEVAHLTDIGAQRLAMIREGAGT